MTGLESNSKVTSSLPAANPSRKATNSDIMRSEVLSIVVPLVLCILIKDLSIVSKSHTGPTILVTVYYTYYLTHNLIKYYYGRVVDAEIPRSMNFKSWLVRHLSYLTT